MKSSTPHPWRGSTTARGMLHKLHDFNPPNRVKEGRSVMDTQQVANFLGVSLTTIYRQLERDPTFPAFRIGYHWRFNREDIDRWRLEAAKRRQK